MPTFLSSNDTEPAINDVGSFFDVAIIGAGVAGLYASYCCGISGLDCCIIDSLMCIGGQCGVLYPEKKVYGVPGFKDIKAKDYIKHLADQCLDYAKGLYFGQKVNFISKNSDDLFCIETTDKKIFAKYLFIASGIGDMKPNVPVNIKGVSDFERKSDFVQYYCMKLDLYKDKEVIIAGGGDSAADFTLNIAPIAKKVILIHRRDKLNCEHCKLEELERFAKQGVLEIVLGNQILEIGEQNSVRYVQTDRSKFDVDYIVFCYGFMPSGKIIPGLEELGLKSNNGLIDVDVNTMETSIENCYASGDVVHYNNKKKNIVPCFFESDRAVRSIKSKFSQV